MITLAELAVLVDGEVIGDGNVALSGATGLDGPQAGTITFAEHDKAIKTALASPVAAVIVPSQIAELAKPGIRVAQPRLAFAKILGFFAPKVNCIPSIHATAVIGDDFQDDGCQIGPFVSIGRHVKIGKGTILHPGAVIEDNVMIGEDTLVHANVVIRENCRIGDRVTLHAGVVIGADGFGYATIEGRHHKIPQQGNVVVEDDVEIGANSTIDRATTSVTLIQRGTKIDNLVQIGHNCVIGADNIICGQAGLAGSTILGDRVTLAGQAGLVGHIEIGHDSVVAGKTKVTGNLPPQSFVSGDPARPHAKEMRIQAALSRLPELTKEVRELRKMVLELKQK